MVDSETIQRSREWLAPTLKANQSRDRCFVRLPLGAADRADQQVDTGLSTERRLPIIVGYTNYSWPVLRGDATVAARQTCVCLPHSSINGGTHYNRW